MSFVQDRFLHIHLMCICAKLKRIKKAQKTELKLTFIKYSIMSDLCQLLVRSFDPKVLNGMQEEIRCLLF